LIDEGFTRRVYLTALIFGAFVLAFLLAYRVQWAITLGGVCGFTIGMLSLWTIDMVVHRVVQPERKKGSGGMVAVSVGKWALIGVALYFIVNSGYFSAAAFAVGFGLVQFVMLSKAAGYYLSGQSKRDRERRPRIL
jgi:hypothetical protein